MNRQDLLDLHDETFKRTKVIMAAKNSDYCAGAKGAQEDPFANFRIASVLGIHPVQGLLMRMMDKMQRVRAFINDGQLAVADETVEDAFDDMVNYAILGKGLLRSMREEQRRAMPVIPCDEMKVELEARVDDTPVGYTLPPSPGPSRPR